MKRSKELNILAEELAKMKSLGSQLNTLIKESELNSKNDEISSWELISRKNFCKKIKDQIDVTDNRSEFLESESLNARLSLGKANREKLRIKNKTREQYLKDKNDVENKILESTNFLRKK